MEYKYLVQTFGIFHWVIFVINPHKYTGTSNTCTTTFGKQAFYCKPTVYETDPQGHKN